MFGCSEYPGGDGPHPPAPLAILHGTTIQEISNPESPKHLANTVSVSLASAVITAVDRYDETADGKSQGTIYVQDVASSAPFSGISLFKPGLGGHGYRPASGDVFSLQGLYQENKSIGNARFPNGGVLPQIFQPVGLFRFESQPPEPLKIEASELYSFQTGRKWLGMVVTIPNITIAGFTNDGRGRVTAPIASSKSSTLITNEICNIPIEKFPPGTAFASVTGVVTYFFDLHIAPRSLDDLVLK